MDQLPPTILEPLAKLGAAFAGTLTSLRFIKGKTRTETVLSALGGVAFSWFASKYVATVLGVPNEQGLVGYLLGLFGMALLAKVYEAIEAINAASYAEMLADWVRKKTGKGE